MKIAVIQIIVRSLGTNFDNLEKKKCGTRNLGKNRDNNIAEIR